MHDHAQPYVAAPTPPAALTADQAARYISVSRRTIYDLLGRGSLRDVRIGRRRLFLREDLDRLLREAAR